MRYPDITKLRRNVIYFIIMAMSVLILSASFAVTFIVTAHEDKEEQKYSRKLDKNIHGVIKRNISHYTFLAKRVVSTIDLLTYMKSGDREGLYAMLRPKWEFFKTENRFLNVMQIHLKDGSSFLRLHTPEHYGDNIAKYRPMLREIHQHHQLVSGYETGMYAMAYRIIAPILDENGTYYGAFEVGIDPNYIVQSVNEVNDIRGVVFVQDKEPELFKHADNTIVDGYRLQSEPIVELKGICKYISKHNKLQNNLRIELGDKLYRTYLYSLKDFAGEDKVKLLFFQDITELSFFEKYLLVILLLVILPIFLLLIWVIYYRIGKFQNVIVQLYEKQISKLDESEKQLKNEKNKLTNIFHAIQDGVYIVNSDYDIEYVNPILVKDFGDYHGKKCYNYFHDSDTICSWCKNSQVQEGKTVHWEWSSTVNGKTYDLLDTPVYNSDGTISKLEIFRDITNSKKVERELLEKSHLLSESQRLAKMGSWKLEIATEKLIWSDEVYNIFEINKEKSKVTLEQFFDGIHPDDLNNVKEAYQNSLKDKIPYDIVHRLLMKDGRIKYVNERCETSFDEAGNALISIGTVQDVTEQKELEEILHQSQEQFRRFMDNIPARVTIKDKDNTILYANKHLLKHFEGRNLIGFNALELLEENVAKKIYALANEAQRNGKAEHVVESSDKDGNITIYRAISFRIGDDEDFQIGSMYFDITNQYNDQHDLAKFKEIIERSPISIVVTDIEGNLEYVNKYFTEVTGYSYDEAIGKNPRILKSDFHNEQDYEELWNEITQNHVWSGTFKNIKKSGEEYWESAIIAPLRDSEGVITNFIGIKQEITEQLYLKRELANKEEIMIAQSRHAAMGEMIGMIAHQWRQPISVIAMGANNMLVDIELEEVDNRAFKEQAESILKQTEYLSKTIDDFRNFFKPDKKMEEVKLEDIMEDAQKIIGKSLENNSIILNITHSDGYKVKTYSRELLQVYINLLKNAKEALLENREDDREINVVIQDDKNFVITTICDNGGGVPNAIIDKIFNPYFSTKDEKTGTGLGLYMSKTIIEKHLHGTIRVKNSKEGACFTVKIPLKWGGELRDEVSV
jgi:PAS domain S-box-containing protein